MAPCTNTSKSTPGNASASARICLKPSSRARLIRSTPASRQNATAAPFTECQGNAVVNYTDAETPYTRIIEHKHFEFGTQPKTVISREYSAEWKKGDEPYYPVNDEKNGALYAEYKKLADAEPGVIFGGRLGEYKYYDMDKVIEVALDVAAKELK